MPTRRGLLAAAAAVASLPLAAACVAADPAPAVPTARPDLVAALRGGGHVVYFRHAATTWSGVDRIEWPRARQRLLSPEGVAQAEAIGAAFRAHAIPVGEVLASPFARCADHARIAFGRADERMALIGLLSDDAGRADRAAFLRDRIVSPPAPGLNRVIVSHRSNIAAVAGVALAEGEGAVLRPDGSGGFVVLGTAMPADW